jgi:hypothetical protein
MMRFNAGAGNGDAEPIFSLDPVEAMAKLEEEKQKKLLRAQKFGIPVSNLGDTEKKAERMDRFKTECGAASSGGAASIGVVDKEKIAERKARFGTLSSGQ